MNPMLEMKGNDVAYHDGEADSHDNDTTKLHQDPATSHHAVPGLNGTTSSTQITRRLSHFKSVTGFNRADAEECLTALAIEIPELERASEAALEEIEKGAIKARERLHDLFQHASGIDNLLHKVFAFTDKNNNNNECCPIIEKAKAVRSKLEPLRTKLQRQPGVTVANGAVWYRPDDR